MPNSSKVWLKAQKIEPIAWELNKDTLYSEEYREKIRLRSLELQSFLNPYIDISNPEIKILEIGGGGTPLIDHFPDCQRHAADPLQDYYNDLFTYINEDIITKTTKAEDLDYDDNYFDLVITRNCIDHVDSLDESLRQIRRVTKPDGKIYIGCNVFKGLLFIIRTIYKDPEHPYTFSHNSLEKIIRNSGFRVDEIRIDDQEQMLHFGEMESKAFLRTLVRNFFLAIDSYHVSEFILTPDK